MTDFLDRWANEVPEQEARNMLERMGVENAQTFTAGELVELANLIAENRQLLIEREIREVKDREDSLTQWHYDDDDPPSKPYFTVPEKDFIRWFAAKLQEDE
jgi:hypothetical protein